MVTVAALVDSLIVENRSRTKVCKSAVWAGGKRKPLAAWRVGWR